jgi:2-polyprenyl-3-methyl-5-hydroxy-6-metoxy-1,4-benzoquinol methylase
VAKLSHLEPQDFAPLLAELGLEPANVHVVDPAPPPPSEGKSAPPVPRGPLLFGQIGAGVDVPRATGLYRERAERALPPDGWALFFLKDRRADGELARWRNHFWPWLHVVAIARIEGGRATIETLQGTRALEGTIARDGVVLCARRREHVLSPDSTVAKFDQNAGGWNGEPGRPGYAHFRWMRKYVGTFASVPRGARILDFGCGAGWVGIEAALAAGGAPLAAFDPSPEMVRIAESNARASGLASFDGRTGFGEKPPFEERYELVLSSGVVSFSPDQRAWFDGLARCVAPGGTLVVGDLNFDSRGMQQRRATRTLLPAREMNALTASLARAELEKRGFRHEETAGYQRTRPIPQLAHWSDQRLGGALSPLLLAYNRACAGPTGRLERFDSWVMRLRAP